MTPYYCHAGITIYHGDCREILPHVTANVMVTDPPYGLGDTLKQGERVRHGAWPAFEQGLAWDSEPVQGLEKLPGLFAASIIWGGNYYALPPSRGWLVWDKIVRSFTSGHCELAWTTLDQPVRAFSYSHGQLANEGKLHPTQKPEPLMSWCLAFLPSNDTIVDPFMGSGTTLVAAKQLGRRAIGIEIEERYCEIAAKRLSQEVLDFGRSA